MSYPTLWYTRCPVPTAFGLALRLGHIQESFAADGIEFTSLRHSSDKKTRESHFSHTLANSFRQGGNIPAIWARSEGADSRLIGLSWNEAPHLILALPESGIKTVKDLKGRKLALRRSVNSLIDFAHALAFRSYQTALESEGLTLKDVEIVDFPINLNPVDSNRAAELARTVGAKEKNPGAPRDMFGLRVGHNDDLFALVRGEVDAIFLETAQSYRIKNLFGLDIVFDTRWLKDPLLRTNNAVPQAFTASGALIDEHPELVARVLAHSIEASEWAKGNPDEAIHLIAVETNRPEDNIREAYGDDLPQHLGIDLSPRNIEAVKEIKRFLLEAGYAGKDFELESWIDRRPLEFAQQFVGRSNRVAAEERPALAAV